MSFFPEDAAMNGDWYPEDEASSEESSGDESCGPFPEEQTEDALKLRARLGDVHSKIDGACKNVKISCDTGTVGNLSITFQRTIRVPDNEKTYQLPPGLGAFPIYSVNNYRKRMSAQMAAKGGVFIPMYQREAMWIKFRADRPFAIRIYVGGINVISGEPKAETHGTIARSEKLRKQTKTVQDYVVAGPAEAHQDWIDGIVKDDGSVAQFVAMPLGSGYTVEAQITGRESIGGMQIEVIPTKHNLINGIMNVTVTTLTGKVVNFKVTPMTGVIDLKELVQDREGIPPDQQRLIYAGKQMEDPCVLADYQVEEGSKIHLVLRLRGGGNNAEVDIKMKKHLAEAAKLHAQEMGIARGGGIKQVVREDFHPAGIWDTDRSIMFSVHILDSSSFSHVTGLAAPPTPVSAVTYASHGYPFFELYEEPSGIVGQFDDVMSVAEKNAQDGRKEKTDDGELDLAFRTITLGENLRPSAFCSVNQRSEAVQHSDLPDKRNALPIRGQDGAAGDPASDRL